MNLLEEKKNNLISHLFLAPFFLFASYFFIPQEIYVNKLLPIAGIVFCLLFPKKGLYLAFFLLGVDAIFQHLASGAHLWLFGFEISLALSFWIFCLAYEETCLRIQTFEQKVQKHEQKDKSIQHELNKELLQCKDTIEKQEVENRSLNGSIKELQLEMQSSFQLMDMLREEKDLETRERKDLSKQLIKYSQKINELEFELSSYKEKLSKQAITPNMEKERNELIDELNYFRVKQFQTTLINEAFAYFVKQEIQKIKQKEVPFFDKKEYQKTRQLIGNYSQLRKQFKEKNDLLRLTRKELYDLTTQYEALKNRFNEKSLHPKALEKTLSQEINRLLTENRHLLEENKQLEKIVDCAFAAQPENSN